MLPYAGFLLSAPCKDEQQLSCRACSVFEEPPKFHERSQLRGKGLSRRSTLGAAELSCVGQMLATFGGAIRWDNLPAHKAAGVRDAIEAAGASLLYLPPYSPDSIRLRTPSPNSRRCCEQRPREP